MVKGVQRYFQCVIPCGGDSSRAKTNTNKCLLKAGKRTVLGHIVHFWKSKGIDDFIFIVGGNSAKAVTEHANELCKDPVIINRGDIANLMKAVNLAEPYIKDKFILALGDCVNFGKFISSQSPLGVGVCIVESKELRKSYLVQIDSRSVTKLIEKPPSGMFGLCGMGTLFLDKRIFHYIKRLSLPEQATSVDLTGMLQIAMGEGENVKPVFFKGEYINVTYPEDFKKVEVIGKK
jgi:dTDP-glucose pyrophosphorylase